MVTKLSVAGGDGHGLIEQDALVCVFAVTVTVVSPDCDVVKDEEVTRDTVGTLTVPDVF